MALQVIKFGGSSVKDSEAISQVLDVVSLHTDQLVVVLSAMGGMTDLLLSAARAATKGESVDEACDQFRQRHSEVINNLIADPKTRESLNYEVEVTTQEFRDICTSLKTLQESTQGILDRTAARGERLIGSIFTGLLNERKRPALFIDAIDVIKVQAEAGQYGPDLEKTTALLSAKVKPHIQSHVIVIPGFIGSNNENQLVTLGRSGSDLSATVIGHGLMADEVILYKEVDGLLTADPRCVPEARIVPEMHYREATELAYYGAKVLHSRTIIPLLEHKIPLIIRNTFHPTRLGTRIAGDVGPGAYPVKAITAIRNQSIISIEGKGMLGVPGIAARTFTTLASVGTSVSMISQASSEASICFVVPSEESKAVKSALQEAFKFELQLGVIEDIVVKDEQSVIAIVGLGMKGTPGIASRSFRALAQSQANIEAIAQGSSELNISVVIDDQSAPQALRGLHREFRLEKLRMLPARQAGTLDFAIYGFGQIGRTLIEQILEQKKYFKDKMALDLNCIGLSDRSGLRLCEEGFSDKELANLTLFKQKGEKLQQTGPIAPTKELFSLPLETGVFVDLTAEDTAPMIKEALSAGMHVALANKKPLAGPQTEFEELFAIAKEKGVMLRYEATVGAGLPILDTLAKLEEAGDQVISVEGCLSGTLGFLMTELEDGSSFSEAVHKAYHLGYTEPDPREDLNGMDVGRKALILARTLGISCELNSLGVESLFLPELSDNDPKKFLANLVEQDKEWAAKIAAAAKKDQVLRYVASVQPTGVTVNIKGVGKDSPLGRLRGTDNVVTIRTKRYDDNPLIVLGPGAGAAVTAAGVLNDIIAIAASNRN